jgi:hypothetical protein
MTQQPPIDQRIVDEYFRLATNKKTKNLAWLYGMIATYGIQPDSLKLFRWGSDDEIYLQNKKKAIYPLHPQWAILFELKEKKPQKLYDSWDRICSELYRQMAFRKVELNVTDLLLAHTMRSKMYGKLKPQPALQLSPVFAGVS